MRGVGGSRWVLCLINTVLIQIPDIQNSDSSKYQTYLGLVWSCDISVLNVHLMEFSCLLVGETSPLGVVLRERVGVLT